MSQTTEIETTDDQGRKLKVRKLDALRELDLIEAAGAASGNDRWMMLATLAACVTDIDGLPLPFPKTKDQIRNHVSKIGSEGIAAVTKALADQVPAEAAELVAQAGN